ncbi:MAG: hypothetical protein QNJ47_27385 [Nostocaceae cyanobacterium]|nr:hypothetical protein [Nostocaceae cyanobacterium]
MWNSLIDIPLRPKVRGLFDVSLGCATEVVLPSLHVRLESPNAPWRFFLIVPEFLEKSP